MPHQVITVPSTTKATFLLSPSVLSDDIRRYSVLYLVPVTQVHAKVKQVAQRSSEEVFVQESATDDAPEPGMGVIDSMVK